MWKTGLVHFAPTEVADYYCARLPDLRRSGTQWRGACPVHRGKDPNFTVNSESGAWFCHSQCGRGGSILGLEMALSGDDFRAAKNSVMRIVHQASGIGSVGRASAMAVVGRARDDPRSKANPGRRIAHAYDYLDEQGKLLSQVVRYDPKGFSQRRPDGRGWWINDLKGVRRVLYNLPAIKEAPIVFIVEGERDADSLIALGFVATTNLGGAGKWEPEYNSYLVGKEVIVIGDNDPPGLKHRQQVVRFLLPCAKKLITLDVPKPYKDVSEWIAAGATRDTIAQALGDAYVAQGASTNQGAT